MTGVGQCWDNAVGESWFATLKRELISEQTWPTVADARQAVFQFIEGWYNPRRRHSALDYQSPINYERNHYSQELTASPPPSTESG